MSPRPALPRTLLACLVVITFCAPLQAAHGPTTAPAPAPAALSIDDVLAIRSGEELLDHCIVRVERLLFLLDSVTDAASARRVTAEAQRRFLELYLLDARIAMFPPPSKEETARVAARLDRYHDAQFRLGKRCVFVQHVAGAEPHLRPVLQPLLVQAAQRREALSLRLVSVLQTLRAQIELYKLQHNDNPPDFRKHGWQQLTQKTDAHGNISPAGKYGPYLPASPRNPLTDSSLILVSPTGLAPAFQHRQGGGFVYEEPTGKIYALDLSGRIFDEGARIVGVDPASAIDPR